MYASSDRLACRNKNTVSTPLTTPTPSFLLPDSRTHREKNMESITSRFEPRSHKTQLVFTALAASALTAAAITSYNSYSRQQKRNELNRQVVTSVSTRSSSSSSPPPPPRRGGDGEGKREWASPPRPEQIYLNGGMDYGSGEWNGSEGSASYSEDLVREQLARNYAFFGEGGMGKIRGASVAVIGCGGVGSWAAVMLARSYVFLPHAKSGENP
jgi:tRNA threonylcarbamoyladenosine dehydratase